MKYIDKYIYAVGRKLPSSQREDIQKELKSLLLDELDILKKDGHEITEQDELDVIKKMGSPGKVAQEYKGTKDSYLISPTLYPTYIMVIKIALAATTLGIVISFIVGYFQVLVDFEPYFPNLLELIGQVVSSALGVIGAITLGFAVIQHSTINAEFENDIFSDFNPKDLPEIPKKQARVSLFESLISIAFIVFALVLFNVYANKIGIFFVDQLQGNWVFIDIFNEEIAGIYLPFWNVLWVSEIIMTSMLMTKGEWTISTHLFDICIKIVGIGVLVYMINGPRFMEFNIILEYVNDIDLTNVIQLLNDNYHHLFYLGIIGNVVHIIGKIVSIVKLAVRPT